MKALIFDEASAAHAVRTAQVAEPAPGPGEVLLRMEAAGLNHVDLLLTSGKLAVKPEPGHILGVEGVGRVVAVGAGVSDEEVGRRFSVFPYLGCGRCTFCLVGEEQVCPVGQTRTIGLSRPGTMAELLAVPVRQLVPVPEGVAPTEAAAVSMTGMTAHRMLVHKAPASPGETVLIRAVGSGVGVMCLQLAKAMGGTVIGTAGSPEKLEMAQRLGMDAGVDHSREDVVARVRELSRPGSVDLVVDYVGAATWEEDLRVLGRGGRLVLCGAHTGTKVQLDLWHLFAKEHRIIGSYGGTRRDLDGILELVAAGTVSPVIDRIIPLEEAAEGLAHLGGRRHFGKVVLAID